MYTFQVAGGEAFPARSMHTAVPVPSSAALPSVYVFGGNFQDKILVDTYRLNFVPSNETLKEISWERKAPMPAELQWHSAVEYNGSIYIFGGFQNMPEEGRQVYSEKLFRYNPEGDEWTELASANFGRVFHEAFVQGTECICHKGCQCSCHCGNYN